MNPGQGYALRRQDLLSIYAASRYFLFFLPRPFPLADLKAVEYRSTISMNIPVRQTRQSGVARATCPD